MHRLIIFIALLPTILFAGSIPTESEILNANHTPLTTLYGAPETNIFGVNVINGDYNYSCVDFDLPGADPLIFQRTYCSSQNRIKAFYHGWSNNLMSKAKTYGESNNLHLILSGAVSGDIPFRTLLRNSDEDLKINRDILKKGVTNYGRGQISGRLNLKNMRVKYAKTGIKVIHPDGTEHLHRGRGVHRPPQPEYYSNNSLTETIKPNGLRTLYDIDKVLLRNVKTLTPKDEISNQIKFDCVDLQELLGHRWILERDFDINAVSDDGKTAKYTFLCRKKKFKKQIDGSRKKGFIISMSDFESSHLPTEHYRYMEREDKQEMLSERYGDHHKTKIDYYKNGDWVNLYHYEGDTVRPGNIARHRVKQISIAVNDSEDLRTLAQFSYRKNKVTKEAFTDVYDSHGHLNRFHYSTKNYRLNCIEKFEGNSQYSLHRIDRFYYGATSTPLEGDLLFKTIASSEETVHYGENYDYDERGNVLKRKLHYRTFTNTKIRPIYRVANPFSTGNERLEGGEVRATTYTYNNLNLPTSQDDGKLTTTFSYHSRDEKATNLLKSKFTKIDESIKRREFYEFDGNAGCILKIEDDGSKSSSDDLTGVKNRKVTRFVNKQGRFAGIPEEIDMWGSNGQEEQRISRTMLEYDAHGYAIKEIHHDANNNLAYEILKIRDIQGNIIYETDPLGQTTVRKYNSYDSLLEEQGPSLNYKMQYSYDYLQRPVVITRKCTDGIDLTTVRSYDLEGKITENKDSYGNQTKFIYNEQGLPVEIIYPPVRTEIGTWIRPIERKQYNFLGHLISETDANGAMTLYTPNDAGLPLKITYPDGTFERFYYSIYGEILEKIQRNRSKVTYSYDNFSRLTAEKTYDRDGTLLKECIKKYSGMSLRSETDGEGLKKSYQYDYAGRVSEIRLGNALTKYLYDPLGRLAEEQRFFGENSHDYIATQFSYDLLNRVTRKKEVDGNEQTHTKIRTHYDPDGNVTLTTTWTHAGAATTSNTYDPRGNLKSSTDPLGNTTYYNHRYDFVFEGENLPCLEVIDPTGVKTTTISDSYGSVISTKIHSPFGELLSDTEMFYDIKGNLIRKEQHLPQETIVTCWKYDSSSRLIRQVNGAGTPEQITTIFIYNSHGELAETQYADGTSKHRIYDGMGRLFEEWSSDQSIHYAYTYNQQDLPTIIENRNTKQETIRKYSREGNLLSECLENGLEMIYRYDRINRIIESIYPDGSSVKQTYDPVFLTKSERIKNGSVIYSTTFTEFDQSGKPQNINFPKNSGKLSLEYDLLSRPVNLSHPCYKERKICYDKQGLLTSKIVNNGLQTFDHDHLQQITLEKTSQYSHTYENDALNRQTAVDGRPQTHNAVHQLIRGADGAYKYDAKGRRIQDSTTKFTYDKFDRLIAAEQGDLIWSYSYDAFNRKMSRTFSDETIHYLYNGHEEIGSYKNNQCLDLKILAASEGSIPIAIELGSQQYAPTISSQGHIVGLVEVETGSLADQSFLTLFGKDLSENSLSPWRFCGKRHEDASLGIIDFGYRFYHPKSAQWLTQDPLGESAGPNLYAYVCNNPAQFVDRFGLFMDNFSFSNTWEGIKETCSNSWNSIKESCSSSWESIRNNCSWSTAADYTINSPRFNGTALAIGGLAECAAGVSLASTGVYLIPGLLIACHGIDGYVAGYNQCYSGQTCNTQTVQLLEKVGMSNGTVSLVDGAFGFGGVALWGAIKYGTKMVSSLSFAFKTEVNLSTNLTKDGLIGVAKKASRNRFSPNTNATGAHSVFRKDPYTGKISHYETYVPQTNPRNPNFWESIKRYDGQGKGHRNKFLEMDIQTPHIHDPHCPGGIRQPEFWELPR